MDDLKVPVTVGNDHHTHLAYSQNLVLFLYEIPQYVINNLELHNKSILFI